MIINVDICICLSSTQTLEVPDNYNQDILKKCINEQIMLPHELMRMFGYPKWIVDDFCVNEV